MSALAAQYNAVNLSQGFPDFNCSDELIDLFSKYQHEGRNQYAPMPGILPLREQVAGKIETLYGRRYDPETEITITAGATQALYTAIAVTIKPGDEAIVFDPAYDSYEPAIVQAGGSAIHIPLVLPDYHIDWNRVKQAVTPKTRLIIINNPHNPTGGILSKNDLTALQALVENTDITIISDEVYEHIVFDGARHQSIAGCPLLAARSFHISSFGKTFHTTGWKVGYCCAPPALTEQFRALHQWIVFAVNTPAQYAFAEFLQRADNYRGLSDFYQKKRDLFINQIQSPRLTINKSAGTYFQLVGYESISREKDTDLALRLIKDFGLAAIPVSVFYQSGFDGLVLRFCFAKKDSTIEQATAIIRKFASS